jgi:hypothetical protein
MNTSWAQYNCLTLSNSKCINRLFLFWLHGLSVLASVALSIKLSGCMFSLFCSKPSSGAAFGLKQTPNCGCNTLYLNIYFVWLLVNHNVDGLFLWNTHPFSFVCFVSFSLCTCSLKKGSALLFYSALLSWKVITPLVVSTSFKDWAVEEGERGSKKWSELKTENGECVSERERAYMREVDCWRR